MSRTGRPGRAEGGIWQVPYLAAQALKPDQVALVVFRPPMTTVVMRMSKRSRSDMSPKRDQGTRGLIVAALTDACGGYARN